MNQRFNNTVILVTFSIILFSGCQSTGGNTGQMQSYSFPNLEAEWIRNGKPIEFEDKLWFPCDDVESLIDSEMYLLGEYKKVQFFAEKMDVRPLNRLYTKFGRNKFLLIIIFIIIIWEYQYQL